MDKKKIRNPEMSDSGKNWNIVTGCTPYSDGCLNCYAKDIVKWLARMNKSDYVTNGFNVTFRTDRLEWPLTNLPQKQPKRPYRSFTTDMGDMFHEKISNDQIVSVFEVMLQVSKHRFYVLTKRADRLGILGQHLPWRPWMWAGVTVESAKYIDRIDHLKRLPKEVNKFIMMEPLLGPMPDLDLDGIDWVVVGGETNKAGNFRPMEKQWVIDIRNQVKNADLPFMFKHLPGRSHNATVALLEGHRWDEYPPSLLRNMVL